MARDTQNCFCAMVILISTRTGDGGSEIENKQNYFTSSVSISCFWEDQCFSSLPAEKGVFFQDGTEEISTTLRVSPDFSY